MTSVSVVETVNRPHISLIQENIDRVVNDLLSSLPNPEQLTSEQRRGIIARYSSVLEGNFIYWMTAAYLSVGSDEVRSIIMDNLLEEVRDSHPHMLRKFTMAAHAAPTDIDALAVYPDLTNVRLFLGRLAGAQNVVTMAFFEGFIQKFMAFLARLAELQGSKEMVYTDVHGVCDITHTQELFRALDIELTMNPPKTGANLFEGVEILKALIQSMIRPSLTETVI